MEQLPIGPGALALEVIKKAAAQLTGRIDPDD